MPQERGKRWKINLKVITKAYMRNPEKVNWVVVVEIERRILVEERWQGCILQGSLINGVYIFYTFNIPNTYQKMAFINFLVP